MIKKTDGLNVVCIYLDNNTVQTGIHMLGMLIQFRSEGFFDIAVKGENIKLGVQKKEGEKE